MNRGRIIVQEQPKRRPERDEALRILRERLKLEVDRKRRSGRGASRRLN